MKHQWKVGDIARTPYEPSGLVRILALEPASWPYDECAFIEFAEDHPAGYRKGEPGRYQLKELRPVAALEQLAANQKDLPPEIADAFDKRFMDLYEPM